LDTIWLRFWLFAAKAGAAVSRANPATVAAMDSLAIIAVSSNEGDGTPASYGAASSPEVKN
jgi:hypothetical protein